MDQNTIKLLSIAFKDTFVEKAIQYIENGVYTEVDQEISKNEIIVGDMTDFEKGLWSYMKSLYETDVLKELRESSKNVDGCVVDQHCLMLVDHENDCHFQKELEEIRKNFESNKLNILRDRELHKRTYGFMIGLIEDRLNLEIKRVGVRKGWKIVLLS